MISFALLQLGAALFMRRNGSRQKFPRFFEYCLLNAAVEAVMLGLLVWGNYALYYYTYWITSALCTVLGFLVIREVFLAALQPLEGLRDLGKIAFRWVAGLLLLVSLVVGLNTHAGGIVGAVSSAFLSLESGVRLIQVGLLLLLYLVSSKIGLSVSGRVFGITLGMGILAAVDLFGFSVLSNSGTNHLTLINDLRLGVGLLAGLTWFAYFALPAVEERPVMVPIASPMMRWNEVAKAFGNPAGRVVYTDGAEPFLPQVERMVDRIFENGMKR
ncbi:MAG: hypothetical protein ABI383_04390 [Acidobacteriaceae bacterium]